MTVVREAKEPTLFDLLEPDTAKPKPPKSEPIYIIDSCGGLHPIKNMGNVERYARRRGWID